jgi:hypothetical protein
VFRQFLTIFNLVSVHGISYLSGLSRFGLLCRPVPLIPGEPVLKHTPQSPIGG